MVEQVRQGKITLDMVRAALAVVLFLSVALSQAQQSAKLPAVGSAKARALDPIRLFKGHWCVIDPHDMPLTEDGAATYHWMWAQELNRSSSVTDADKLKWGDAWLCFTRREAAQHHQWLQGEEAREELKKAAQRSPELHAKRRALDPIRRHGDYWCVIDPHDMPLDYDCDLAYDEEWSHEVSKISKEPSVLAGSVGLRLCFASKAEAAQHPLLQGEAAEVELSRAAQRYASPQLNAKAKAIDPIRLFHDSWCVVDPKGLPLAEGWQRNWDWRLHYECFTSRESAQQHADEAKQELEEASKRYDAQLAAARQARAKAAERAAARAATKEQSRQRMIDLCKEMYRIGAMNDLKEGRSIAWYADADKNCREANRE